MDKSFFVHSDGKTSDIAFPDQLSAFFSDYETYGEYSELAQVTKLLHLDLSMFQLYDPSPDDPSWQSLDELKHVVNLFIEKLRSAPDFFQNVKHGPGFDLDPTDLGNIDLTQDMGKAMDMLHKLTDSPDINFPPDNGYLSGGMLLEDLEALKAILAAHEQAGAKKVSLVYM